jgi:hypothetical protein
MEALIRFLKNWLLVAILLATWSLCLGAISAGFLIAFQVPSKIAEYQRAQAEATNKPQPDAATEKIAEWTIVLAAFTGVLAIASIWQGGFIKDQIKLARQEFAATHRPKVRVRRISLVGLPAVWQSAGFSLGGEISATVLLVNIGDSDADVYWSCTRLYFGQVTYGSITYRKPVIDSSGALLQSGGAVVLDINDVIECSEEENGRIIRPMFARNEWHLYVMGEVRYKDGNGAVREMGFCREMRDDGRFHPVDDPAYEYEE